MMSSGLHLRLNIPTPLVRAFGVPATVFLLLLLVSACGGQSKQESKQESKEEAKQVDVASEKAAVEEAVRGYLMAHSEEDYAKAYSYLIPPLRSNWSSQDDYVSSQPSTVSQFGIDSVKVNNIDKKAGDKAAAVAQWSEWNSLEGYVNAGVQFSLAKKDGQWKLDNLVANYYDTMPLEYVPLGVSESSQAAEPGWKVVYIDIGIRNITELSQEISVTDQGTLYIKESDTKTYDTVLQFADQNPGSPASELLSSDFEGFQLPPGFALCGLLTEDPSNRGATKPRALRAAGIIPQETTPDSLVIGSQLLDLTNIPSRTASCEPDENAMADLPTTNEITVQEIGGTNTSASSATQSPTTTGTQQEGSKATLHFFGLFSGNNQAGEKPYARTLIDVGVKNQDKFDDFVGWFQFWVLDNDGVIRTPYGTSPEGAYGYRATPADGFCNEYDNPTEQLYLGPSQATIGSGSSAPNDRRVCFPYRTDHRAVALVVATGGESGGELTFPSSEVVRLTEETNKEIPSLP